MKFAVRVIHVIKNSMKFPVRVNRSLKRPQIFSPEKIHATSMSSKRLVKKPNPKTYKPMPTNLAPKFGPQN
jgi:hypothetical protein